jgi:hypothetical protein
MFEDLAAAGSTLPTAFVVPRYREEFRLSSALQRTLLDLLAPGARFIGLARYAVVTSSGGRLSMALVCDLVESLAFELGWI